MRSPIFAGVAAAAALAVVAVVPTIAAGAAEPAPAASTVETVTPFTSPANVAVEIAYDYDVWEDSGALTTGGGVTYPLVVDEYDGNFVHAAFRMSSVPADNCVRTITSFTFGFTLADYWDADFDSVPVTGAIGTGDPIALIDFGASPYSYAFSGTGVDIAETNMVKVHLETMRIDPAAQSGVLTIMYPEPVAFDVARGYINLAAPANSDWIIDHASFDGNDTCTTVVTPPTTEPPVTDPPATDPPVTDPPVTEPPITEPPVTEPPVTDPPVTDPPISEPPVTEPPVTEPPVTEPPVTEPPVTDPPVTEPPVTEPAVTEPPVTEIPVTGSPVIEPPRHHRASHRGSGRD